MPHIQPYHYLHSYVHNGRIGVLVEFGCESDFLIRMEAFQAFAHDMALQIAATAPEDVEMLLLQPFVKDEARSVSEIVQKISAKFHEHIAITRFIRWSTDPPDRPDHTSPPRTPAVILSFRRAG
jgi:elongation factor Ts